MLNFDEILNQKQASNPQPWQPQSSSWTGVLLLILTINFYQCDQEHEDKIGSINS